ncbi:MAG: Uma2 family endonuclease [Methylobacter sp.]
MSYVLTPSHFSAEEYLTLERSASCKSEFHNGQIYAMTGANREHNLVTINIAGELSIQLKKRPCEAYVNDMRVKAAEARRLPLSGYRCCLRYAAI